MVYYFHFNSRKTKKNVKKERIGGHKIMSWIDWLIVILPIVFVVWIAFFSKRYVKGVVDYLAAGRLAGRFLM